MLSCLTEAEEELGNRAERWSSPHQRGDAREVGHRSQPDWHGRLPSPERCLLIAMLQTLYAYRHKTYRRWSRR